MNFTSGGRWPRLLQLSHRKAYLGQFVVADGLENDLIDACKPNDILVAHHQRCATIHDRPHGQLRLERRADLADHNWHLMQVNDRLSRWEVLVTWPGDRNGPA